MSISQHIDSPILLAFPCKPSNPKSTLSCITEQPQQQHTFLNSPNTSSSASLSPPLPQEEYPSSLSLSSLCYEEFYETNGLENWNEGWDLRSAFETGDVTSMHGCNAPVIPQEEFRINFGQVGDEPTHSYWSEDERSGAGSSKPIRESMVSWKERGIRGRRNLKRCIKSVARRFRRCVRR
jgi:hypothetical protein